MANTPVRQYIGARYVPVFANPITWTNERTYEPLTIVLHAGNSYTSRQYVPAGIDINNTDYWANTGNYNAQIEQYRNESQNALKYLNAFGINSEQTGTENLNKLNTTSQNSNNNTAALTALNAETTEKARHLNNITKINEYFITPQMFGAKGDGVTDDSQAFNNAINAIVNTYNVDGLYYTLFVPAGKYLIEHTITLHSFICIKSLGEVTFIINTQIGFHVKHINVHIDGKTTGQLFDGSNGYITIQPKDTTQTYNGTAISINDPTSPNFMRGKTFNYLNIRNFNYAYDIVGNDIYLTKFTNIEITDCNYGLHFGDNIKNAGENLKIQNATISCKKECITLTNGYELYINNTSFDFTSTVLKLHKTNNKVVFKDCHFEAIKNQYAIIDESTSTNYSFRNQITLQDCTVVNSQMPFIYATSKDTTIFNYNNTYEYILDPASLTNKDLCNDNVHLSTYTPFYYIFNGESGGKTKNLLVDTFNNLDTQSKTSGTLNFTNNTTGWQISDGATYTVKNDQTYGKVIEITNITKNISLLSPPINITNATNFIAGYDLKTATPSWNGSIVMFNDNPRDYIITGQYEGNKNKLAEHGNVWMTTESMYYYVTSCNYTNIRLKIEIYHETNGTPETYTIAKPRLFAY